jgi:hypothetical protein
MEPIMTTRSDSDVPGVSWSAAAEAGLMGGVVYLVLELILVPLFVGGSVWSVLRMIAAIVLGRGVLPPPDTFDVAVVLTGAVLHLLLATLYGLVLSAMINRAGPGVAVLLGAMVGLVLYIINYYVFTAVFPWFASARTWVTVFTHLVFGFVVAWSYKTVAGTPRRAWALER